MNEHTRPEPAPAGGPSLHENSAADPLRARLAELLADTEGLGPAAPLGFLRELIGLTLELAETVAKLQRTARAQGAALFQRGQTVPAWLEEHAKGERLDSFAVGITAGLLSWGGPSGCGSVHDVAKVAYDYAAGLSEERDRRVRDLAEFRRRRLEAEEKGLDELIARGIL